MTRFEAEPRVESQTTVKPPTRTAKEVLKKYPEVKGILIPSFRLAPPASMKNRPQGQVFTAGTGMPAANAQIRDGLSRPF